MRLQILPLPCEYIFSLIKFTVNNQEHYKKNSALLSVNIRNRNNLYRPASNLSCFQKVYLQIKIFSNLPNGLECLNKIKQFKVALKRHLNIHSLYSVEEFLMFKNKS
jgi:hypothetical protein